MIVDLRQQHSSVKVIIIGVALAIFRFLPVREYSNFMNWQLKWLDKNTLRYHSNNLIECIKLDKKESQEYKNTNDEVNSLLAHLNILQPYKMRIMPFVTSHRRKYGLKI
jgi:hypothetical protein